MKTLSNHRKSEVKEPLAYMCTGQCTQDLCMPSNLMAKVLHFYPDRQEGQTKETFR